MLSLLYIILFPPSCEVKYTLLNLFTYRLVKTYIPSKILDGILELLFNRMELVFILFLTSNLKILFWFLCLYFFYFFFFFFSSLILFFFIFLLYHIFII